MTVPPASWPCWRRPYRQRPPRIDFGVEPEKDGEARCVAFLAASRVEGDRMVAEVGLQVDFVEKSLCARSLCPLRLLPGLKTIDLRL